MRGAFVACFGEIDQPRLERIAAAHRWHRGTPEYHAAPRFHVAVLADPVDGPHVEMRDGNAHVVHGRAASLGELMRRGDRFVGIETDGETLRAARDPLALAPLFFRQTDESLWLATEVTPLVELGPPGPDPGALVEQTVLIPDEAATGFRGIRRLLPGHVLHSTRDLQVTQRPYWDPAGIFGGFDGNRREAQDELWARLLDAVDRNLTGPTGILVSGGLDSAAVTAAAALLGRPLALTHVTFPGFADVAEEPQARAVAAAAGAQLDVVSGDVSPWDPRDDLEVSVIPYLTPPDYTANAGLAHLAGCGLSDALDGNDGDGVLGYAGREWGELLMTGSLGRLRELTGTYGARNVARGLSRDLIPPALHRPLRGMPPRAPTYPQTIEHFFDPRLRERILALDHERWRRPFGEWRWRQLRQVLPVTTTRMEEHELRGARYGIDLRHPFADRYLVEFLISLPAAIKSDPLRPKALLRDALVGHAPDDVLTPMEKPQYLSIFDHRVDRARCLEWIEGSGVRLPFVKYEVLLRDGDAPLFLLVLLARAHVFAAGC
jgi:asparagine synthase (glutamine-hydrolysing)